MLSGITELAGNSEENVRTHSLITHVLSIAVSGKDRTPLAKMANRL